MSIFQTAQASSGSTSNPTVYYAPITASASGATSVVTATASKKITVQSLLITTNGAVNVKFQSHTTPTDLTGLMYFGANGGAAISSMQDNPGGLFQTNAGEQLDINLSGAVAVGGFLTYTLV